jgi:tRNA U34 5-carboxymethylaminomethyl modifying enzyme MnmG/GidA
MNERSNHSESRSKHRIQARADAKCHRLRTGGTQLNPVSPEKSSSTDEFNNIEKVAGRVKLGKLDQLVACNTLAGTGIVTCRRLPSRTTLK